MDTIHLQGIGKVPAVQAQELGVGDVLMWNQGERSTVVAVAKASAQFLLFTMRSVRTGQEHERRMRRTRLVARVEAAG